MSYIQSLNERAKYIEQTIAKLQRKLEKLPSGTLRCYDTSGYDKYFHKINNEG